MPHNKNTTGSSAGACCSGQPSRAWVGRDGPRGLGGQEFLVSLNPSGVMEPSDEQCSHSTFCKAQADVIAWTKIHTGAGLWALHMDIRGITLAAKGANTPCSSADGLCRHDEGS